MVQMARLPPLAVEMVGAIPSPVAVVAYVMGLARRIRTQEVCSRQMTALAMLRILMMLIVSVVALALLELDLGTVYLADSAVVRIVVVIRSTFAAFALSELPVLHPIRPPRTLEAIRAMVEGIARLNVSPSNLIRSRSRRDIDAGLLT